MSERRRLKKKIYKFHLKALQIEVRTPFQHVRHLNWKDTVDGIKWSKEVSFQLRLCAKVTIESEINFIDIFQVREYRVIFRRSSSLRNIPLSQNRHLTVDGVNESFNFHDTKCRKFLLNRSQPVSSLRVEGKSVYNLINKKTILYIPTSTPSK